MIQVVIDCADPAGLAPFWAEALGYVLQPPPPGFDSWEDFAEEIGIPPERRNDLAAVVDPDGDGPRLLFQRVPEAKTVKNRVHLDVPAAPELEGERRWEAALAHVRRLEALGATRLGEHMGPAGERWIVLADPEGNEFCVT
ncbi:MAG: VOC family protein [Acidimicrobiia bacterium]|nr:VOC family protein [Acidimicrobiia bacterium]